MCLFLSLGPSWAVLRSCLAFMWTGAGVVSLVLCMRLPVFARMCQCLSLCREGALGCLGFVCSAPHCGGALLLEGLRHTFLLSLHRYRDAFRGCPRFVGGKHLEP